jgi:elongation factor G
MKPYPVEQIRNVGVVGHGGAGKTSLVEGLLYSAGAIERLGSVASGNTAMDYEPEEIHRKISISSSIGFCEWSNHRIHLIDTPGYLDFFEEAKYPLTVADGLIFVGSGVIGCKAEAEKIKDFLAQAELPCLGFINEMDRDRADFNRAVEAIKELFDLPAIPLTFPTGTAQSLNGVIDLLEMKWIQYGSNGKPQKGEIPGEYKAEAEEFRKKLVEKIAEEDDLLLEKFLNEGDLGPDEIRSGIRQNGLTRKFIPVICGSAAKNVGMLQLLDHIPLCIPSSGERSKVTPLTAVRPGTSETVTRLPDPSGPFSAMVIKTLIDPFAGRLSYFKVLSGSLEANLPIYNASRTTREKGGHLFSIQGKKYTPIHKVQAGDIAAIAKLKDTYTGDSLCDERDLILFSRPKLSKPAISIAVEPKLREDEEKVSLGLAKLLEEDPTLEFHRDPETKEMILSGMSQLHLEVTQERLKRKYGVELNLKTPKVGYKETIRTPAKAQGRYKKQSGGHGHFADAWLQIEPLPKGAGFQFVNQIVGGAIPRQFIPYVEKGVHDAMQKGILSGCPVIDVKATLYDGSYHTVDSAGPDFEIAGAMAFKKAMTEAHPVLLEPIMTVDVVSPDDVVGAVIGDLNSRRGRILNVEAKSKSQRIKALVPIAEILKYAPTLSSLTGGRGSYSMEFSHYEEVPAELTKKIIEERKPAAAS